MKSALIIALSLLGTSAVLAVGTGLGFIAGLFFSVTEYWSLRPLLGAVIGFAAALMGLIVFWGVVARVRSRRRSSAPTSAAHASNADESMSSADGPGG